MWKVIFLFCFLLSMGCTIARTASELRKKYPHEMLSEDYGILKDKDVHFYHIENEGTPDKVAWTCIRRSDVRFKCHDQGASKWRPVEHYGVPEVHVLYNNELSIYDWGRGIEIDDCQWQVKNWNKITQGAPYLCIAGYRVGESKTAKEWRFERLQTQKICDSRADKACENRVLSK